MYPLTCHFIKDSDNIILSIIIISNIINNNFMYIKYSVTVYWKIIFIEQLLCVTSAPKKLIVENWNWHVK